MSTIVRPWGRVTEAETRKAPCSTCERTPGNPCAPDGGTGTNRTSGGKLKARREGYHYARYEAAYRQKYGVTPNVPTWGNGEVSAREMFNGADFGDKRNAVASGFIPGRVA